MNIRQSVKSHPFPHHVLMITVLATAVCVPRVARSAQPFDYHTVRGRVPAADASGVYEGETRLKRQGRSRIQGMRQFGRNWSGNAHLLWDGVVGDAMETTFGVEQPGRYRFLLQLTKAPDYGVFSVVLNGVGLGKGVDLYAGRVELAALLDLGEVTLKAGGQKLVMTLTGANPRAKKFRGRGYLMGLDYLKIIRLDPPPKIRDARATPAPAPRPVASRVRLKDVKRLMATYCYRCHGGKKTKGKVNLKQITTEQGFLANIELPRKAARMLARHEMPPDDEKQLPRALHDKLTAFFLSTLDKYIRTSGTLPSVVMRRLNRYEYNNAVRDLLKLKGDIYPLPEKVMRPASPYFNPRAGRFPDSIKVGNRPLGKRQVEQQILTGVVPFAVDLQAEHGFNNRGGELGFSTILLESFLALGKSIVNSPEFDRYCGLSDSLFRAPGGLSSDAQVRLAEARLRAFLERAFRGPPDEPTARRYVRFFRRELARSGKFSRSMKNAVAAVLASPRFLFLVERKRDAKAEERVTAHELATRLSMFLWSSIPDEPLLALARTGQLLRPDVLQAQVVRMLEDRRSQALSENFARQWLRLDQLISAVPDFDRYPIYYARLGCEQFKFGCQTMIEPLLLFESIMVEDRSIMLLVDSNYSYRSDDLQSWYAKGVPFKKRGNRNRFNTFQVEFRRRQLDTRRQGGVITSAATLTMTSSPLRTGPISRGAWVATVIFNQPPPPPPDDVPAIEADDDVIEAKGLTLRERLKQHQVKKSCVSCHAKIDPLGFALENYDTIGRWRDTYRSGLKIDASGALFGEAKFSDVVGLKDAILKRPEWFMRAFSEHLLSYALGRKLELHDKLAVDRIVRKALSDHGRFSTIVHEIVMSYPFLHKTRQSEKRP